jgi:hypothetical protein
VVLRRDFATTLSCGSLHKVMSDLMLVKDIRCVRGACATRDNGRDFYISAGRLVS